jgi:endonuclease/exonuclease/phosphatase family metal-dependent hydrolase
MRSPGFLTVVLFLALGVGCGGGRGAEPVVTVMTQNLYYGTEFDGAIAALATGDEEGFVLAVTEAWARVQATDFPTRAAAIAAEIEAVEPALIGLQEAALWRVQVPSDPTTAATEVVYDFVGILLDALAARGLDYEVAATFTGLDVEFPFLDETFSLSDVRLTDREIVLARRGGALSWSNPQAGAFAVNLPLPGGVEVRRGWAAVDADLAGRTFRFVSTHLEADDPGVRAAQADEIAQVVAGSPLPPVLVGDFNYDVAGFDPDAAAFLERLAEAGLELGAPVAGGTVTCCADEWLSDPTAAFTERLDLIFHAAGFQVLSEDVLGNAPTDMRGGLWPSDHAAVGARLFLP